MPREFRPPTDEQQCTATTRKGTRCSKFRVKGTTVCLSHGASAPQVRAAADRRVQEGKVRELAARADVDVTQFNGDPRAALLDLLARDRAELERFGRLVARLSDGNEVYTAKSGVQQLRAEFTAYRAERDAGRQAAGTGAQG